MSLTQKRKSSRGNHLLFVTLFVLSFLILLSISTSALTNASLHFQNASEPNYIPFDRAGSNFINNNSYGANAYIDHTPGMDNLYLTVCHPDLVLGDKVDLLYYSENKTLFSSVVNFLPLVTEVTSFTNNSESYNCSLVDISLSSMRALYPGYLVPLLIPSANTSYNHSTYNMTNTHLYGVLNPWFNGSYAMQIHVEGPPKKYLISTKNVYDENGQEIFSKKPFLVTSFLNANNITLAEGVLSPQTALDYDDKIVGGEKVYVNGIKSMEIIAYAPCTPINKSGYYVMNASEWNRNDTCVLINNTDNMVLNFGGEVIDGDHLDNGSFSNDTCSVFIEDSENVTLENFLSQDYYYGLCIKNSTVTVFGSGVTYNFRGAKIYKGSTATLVGLAFDNDESEIASYDNSTVNLIKLNFTTAQIKSTFSNVVVRSVENPPEPPPFADLVDIDQYIEYTNTSDSANAQINFYYDNPMPNNAVADNITIFKYDEEINTTTISYINQTYNATTNTTTNVSYNVTTTNVTGNWTELFTLVSTSEQLIVSPNISSFSIFAPFAEKGPPIPEPTPTPTPTPTPKPQAGPGSGNGGTPLQEELTDVSDVSKDQALILKLDIPENITLMQGESSSINFTLSNKGNSSTKTLYVGPLVRPGWDYTNYTINNLDPGQNQTGEFQLAPYEKELPGKYYVPVNVYVRDGNDSIRLITRLLQVEVIPRGTLQRLKVLEYPPEIQFKSFENLDVSFFTKNIGDRDLKNLTIDFLDNDCLKKVEGTSSLLYDQTKELKYKFSFGTGVACDVNLKFYRGEDLVGFLPLHLVKKERQTLFEIPQGTKQQFNIWLIIFTLWTVFAIFALERRRRRLQ